MSTKAPQPDLDKVDKLIDSIQAVNDKQLYQYPISKSRLASLIGLLVVMVGFCVYLGISQQQSSSVVQARYLQALTLINAKYSQPLGSSVQVSPDYSYSLSAINWEDYAQKHQGIKRIVGITRDCDVTWHLESSYNCYFSFQTQFNDESYSLVYGVSMSVKDDKLNHITIQNSAGAITPLANPKTNVPQ